jgi:hypothetical protein
MDSWHHTPKPVQLSGWETLLAAEGNPPENTWKSNKALTQYAKQYRNSKFVPEAFLSQQKLTVNLTF